MKRAVLIPILILSLAGGLVAQEYKGKGRLSGFVYDEQGNPLEGVTVKLMFGSSGQGPVVKSGQDGKWTAAWIRSGSWNVDFEKIGYAPKKISLDIKETQKNPDVTITMVKVEGLVMTDDIRELLTLGNELYSQEKYEEAAAKFREILEKYPDAYPIYVNLGNCFFAREDYDQAEENYLKALEKDPAHTETLIAIGNCYTNRGDSAKALEWYSKVEFEKIADPIVLYNLGTNYYNSSKFEEAAKFYAKAVDKRPDFTDALYQLGLAYLSLQKNAESVAFFERYLAIDGDSPRAGQVRAFLDYLKKK